MIIPSIKLDVKQKIIAVLISIIAASFILIFIFFIPNINKVKNLYLDLSRKKNEVQGLIKSGATSLSLSKQIELVNSNLVELQNSLLIPGKEIEFIQFLENLAREYNIKQTINLSSVKTAPNTPSFRSADLSLTVEGNFYNFLNYIIALEKSSYYINIKSISLSVNKDSTGILLSVDNKRLPNSITLPNLSNDIKQDELVAKINSKIFWQND